MKRLTAQPSQSRFLRFLGAAGVALCALPLVVAAQLPPVSSPTSVAPTLGSSLLGVPVPASVFVDDFTIGKDPFYPNSNRRAPAAPREVRSIVKSSPDLNRIQLLTLRGITGPAEARLALINNMTFVTGETGNVRTTAGLMKIRVLDIHDKTAVVAIEGEPGRHELKLRDSNTSLTGESKVFSTVQK